MPLPSRTSRGPERNDSVFRILTVCSGNLCRSPQAEQLLRTRIPAALGGVGAAALDVSSAGTVAFDGDHMDEFAAEEAARLGIDDAVGHRARRITEQHVADADLILGMAREHRAAASSLVPRANRRVFTLVEFARIVDALAGADVDIAPPGQDGFAAFMRRVVDVAVAERGLMPMPEAPIDLDIEDPYRRAPDIYRRSADAVAANVDRIAAAVAAIAGAGRRPLAPRASEGMRER
jgi:protein-tyrosine phosphatase